MIVGFPVENQSTEGDDPTLVGADLRDTDLRHRDLSDLILFQTDLRGANLYGAKVSLRCQTFDSVKLSDEQVSQILLMLQTADINPKFQVGIRDLVRRVTGEKYFAALSRWLRLV